MELQVLGASGDATVAARTGLAAGSRIEIKRIGIAPMAAIAVVHLVQNGFNF